MIPNSLNWIINSELMMNVIDQISEARAYINQGKIIAYPTEAVYGLGCDPFNNQAVEKLLNLKQRDICKGFILLIADWSQLATLIKPVSEQQLAAVRKTWPGPVTWVFPKADTLPDWLSGQYNTIALRMSAHPIAHELCIDGPLISTSANISKHEPANDISQLQEQFPQGIDALVAGNIGGASRPSAIYDVLTGGRLR